MKEYKVITPSLGFRNKHKKLEEILNSHARDGWILNSITPHAHGVSFLVFERNKNR
ncbi:MAG TPA: DUF4177 domain-containing protein [Flavobacteriaceae bacterium]|nr:DUF4177 domain-containing protein [Flavobacteriaceae bacterium]